MRVIYAESKQNLSNMTYGLSYILMNVSFIKVMCFLFDLLCVCVCVCVCVGVGHVYVVYEDTNLYNDMGMT